MFATVPVMIVLVAVIELEAAARADEETWALKAQTARRTIRRAEREKGFNERARVAAKALASGEWKALTFADSAQFARDYKLGLAKKVRLPRTSDKSGYQAKKHHDGNLREN